MKRYVQGFLYVLLAILFAAVVLVGCADRGRDVAQDDGAPEQPTQQDSVCALQAAEDFISRFLTLELWAGGELGIRNPESGNFYSYPWTVGASPLDTLPMLSLGGLPQGGQLVFDGWNFYDRFGFRTDPGPPTVLVGHETSIATGFALYDRTGEGTPYIFVTYASPVAQGTGFTVIFMLVDGQYSPVKTLPGNHLQLLFDDVSGRMIMVDRSANGRVYYQVEINGIQVSSEQISAPETHLRPIEPLVWLQDSILAAASQRLGIAHTPREWDTTTAAPPEPMPDGEWYIVSYNLHLREYHSTDAPSLGIVPGGARVRALVYAHGDDRDWVMVDVGGQVGFMAAEFLIRESGQ